MVRGRQTCRTSNRSDVFTGMHQRMRLDARLFCHDQRDSVSHDLFMHRCHHVWSLLQACRVSRESSVLKRIAHQRFVAWLALAAMALVVLMPMISRTMPVGAPMMGMDADCAMDTGQADHRRPDMPGQPDDPTARCAYCVLLTHTPVVGLGTALLWTPVDLPALAPETITQRSEPSAPLLSARPRGPPRSIVS